MTRWDVLSLGPNVGGDDSGCWGIQHCIVIYLNGYLLYFYEYVTRGGKWFLDDFIKEDRAWQSNL